MIALPLAEGGRRRRAGRWVQRRRKGLRGGAAGKRCRGRVAAPLQGAAAGCGSSGCLRAHAPQSALRTRERCAPRTRSPAHTHAHAQTFRAFWRPRVLARARAHLQGHTAVDPNDKRRVVITELRIIFEDRPGGDVSYTLNSQVFTYSRSDTAAPYHARRPFRVAATQTHATLFRQQHDRSG